MEDLRGIAKVIEKVIAISGCFLSVKVSVKVSVKKAEVRAEGRAETEVI